MKKYIFFMMVMSFLGVHSQNSMNAEFWKKDKIGHAQSSFIISTGTYVFLATHKKYKHLSEFKKRLISFSIPMLLGCVKEIHDMNSPNNNAQWGDMEANLIGSLAFQVSVTIPLNFKKNKTDAKLFTRAKKAKRKKKRLVTK